MRFAGLSICLLVSTLTARAASLEEQLVTLEQRIKVLEGTLQEQGASDRSTLALPDGAKEERKDH